MDIKVLIPTYRRAGRVTTVNVVSNAILCVTESEKDEYREHYPRVEIATHPDSVLGLAAKRQWMYQTFGDIFMLDDDIKRVFRLYNTSGTHRIGKVYPDEAYEIIQWAGNTAALCGCYLFGFNKSPNPLLFDVFRPILLSGYITGCAHGILKGSRIEYSPLAVAVEDFYASGLNAHFHRRAFIDTRFNFAQQDTFKNVGGLSTYRTTETEKQDTLFLRRMFGEAISLKKSAYGKGRAKSTNKNPYGRVLKIPF